ncbi:alpha-ketoglutarate-dependent dioxygenase AlkB family protein [Thaumasiovibrio sp. DFM-14]|uniref:alpha-ketoglutarate-dependent dioxygenase AlkB family protein n=1 Tax=Thaumasiovibrio sp. DFM-14 TaxID=3384792 RepID=UPI00399F6BB7
MDMTNGGGRESDNLNDQPPLPLSEHIEWFPNWLDQQEAGTAFDTLRQQLPWQQYPIQLFGRTVLQPRLQVWMGEADYTYSGLKMSPVPWHALVLQYKQVLEQRFECPLNACLLNLYRDGHDYMGFHRDNEPELGGYPNIFSLSLGVERRFVFQHITTKETWTQWLTSGSLLYMKGACQRHWKHALPKALRVTEPRINLTYRYIQQ